MNPYDPYNEYDITATQDNTIYVDFDTYTFHKGDQIIMNISNPFYFDITNAPDLYDISEQKKKEVNNCGLIYCPKDVVNWSSLTIYNKLNTVNTNVNYQLYPFATSYHQNILYDIYERNINSATSSTLHYYRNFCNIYQTNESINNFYKFYDLSYTNAYKNNLNSNLLWIDLGYTYFDNFIFPIVNTISIYTTHMSEYSINSIDMNVLVNNNLTTLNIPQGVYTFSSFNNIIRNVAAGYQHMSSTNPNLTIYRFYGNGTTNHGLIYFNNEEFDKYFGVLHTINTYSDTNYRQDTTFLCNVNPNFKTLHIDEGFYTPSDLVNIINNNKYDLTLPLQPYCFEAVSSGNDIYIQTVDNEFIFNTSMPFQHPDTDFSTTPTSSKKLVSVCPESINFNSTVNGIQVTGEYTPATFLRMIKEQTKCNFIINSNRIICSDIIECENPYFIFTDQLVNGGYKVINKCNLTRWQDIMIFNHPKYFQYDLNKFMKLTPSITDYGNNTIRNLPYYTYTGNEVCNAYNTNYLTTTNTFPVTKLTNSCATYFSYSAQRSYTGFIRCNCASSGSHSINIYGTPENDEIIRSLYEQRFSTLSSGCYDICLNIPLIRTSYYANRFTKIPNMITVTGDVDVNFDNVIVETNNYNSNLLHL